LLILAGEIVLADGAANVLQGGERLARGVQRFARPPGEALRSPDRLDLVHLVGFGDCREAHHLPRLLLEHVADRSSSCSRCMMMTMAPRLLSFEPAVEGVIEPFVGSLSRASESASSGFSGSSIRMMSAPRPVSTPPLEVARR